MGMLIMKIIDLLDEDDTYCNFVVQGIKTWEGGILFSVV